MYCVILFLFFLFPLFDALPTVTPDLILFLSRPFIFCPLHLLICSSRCLSLCRSLSYIQHTHTHTDTICHFIACPVSQSVCLRDYGVVCANMGISRLLYLPFYRLPSISPVSLSALSISLSPSLPAKCMTIPLSCSNQPLLPYLYRTRLAVQLCLRSQMLLSTQQRAAGQT